MKRFIAIVSLMAGLAAPAWACLWMETHNYYLFSVCRPQSFSDRVAEVCNNNWKAYLGSTDEYYYFNAKEVAKAARAKGDALMATYAEQLARYMECVAMKRAESWDYPTKEQLAQQRSSLTAIRAYAQSKVKSRLRSQHALLYMRCNMMLGQHAENVTFWTTTASQFIETVYKDMMKNIYAGALLRTGSFDEAGQLFAEMGDWESLMTQYYKKRSFAAIQREYLRDPQSAVLPFLLQDFVNNCQEATDVDNPLSGGIGGKLFIRDIQRSEAQQMIQLAARAATEGRTQHPAMWQSAKAWLEFLYGNRQQAQTDIGKALAMKDSTRFEENARVLNFYITAMNQNGHTDTRFDDFVAREMLWLDSLGDGYGDHYDSARDRIVHQALHPCYLKDNRPETGIALLNAVHAWEYEDTLNCMPVDHLLRFLDYVQKPATNSLERYVKERIRIEPDIMNDLVGTKYLRTCQWKKAIEWLEKVPLSFYNDKGYASYAAYRSYKVEPWITRQWLTEEQAYGDERRKLTENPKMVFAREMLNMESSLALLNGEQRYQRCYDLAVRYAQAAMSGDCWFLLSDNKNDYPRKMYHDVNYEAKALELLQQAAQTNATQLRERVLFAQSYVYLNPDRWFEMNWDNEAMTSVLKPLPLSKQYKAFATLLNFERSHTPSTYVSNCEEYRQFSKYYQ